MGDFFMGFFHFIGSIVIGIGKENQAKDDFNKIITFIGKIFGGNVNDYLFPV